MDRDIHFLKMAARLALRGHGGAEPNPMVGCVIVSSSPGKEIVGWGYHRKCGSDHAEVVALKRARDRALGATLYCTLEPCDHTGRTPPCTKAIIEAGIKRVVIGRRDPNPLAACGLARLQRAGIQTTVVECEEARSVSDPFVHRIQTSLPWVIVKWAQTIDGKIATRPPNRESKWISNERSRRLVHRERGRVDAILTGIGTVLKDDPSLTARDIPGKPRRVARRVVIDPRLEIPLSAKLVTTATIAPTTIFCSEHALNERTAHAASLREAGVEVIGLPTEDGSLPLGRAMKDLVKRHDVSNVMVEAGAGLMSRLFQLNLVNEAWMFIAPMLLGDAQAPSAIAGWSTNKLMDAARFKLIGIHRRKDDIFARYRATPPGNVAG